MNAKFANRVYKLQNGIVRELNNSHIFLAQAQPVLDEAKKQYRSKKSLIDRQYYVPSHKGSAIAKRNDRELRDIYDFYLTKGLFESFLVYGVARFEAFLSDVLIAFFDHYPLRIMESVQGLPPCRQITAKELIDAVDKKDLQRKVIREHVTTIFRQKPIDYLRYMRSLIDTKDDPSFLDYYEIAATRDLCVHNNLIINQLYLTKAGTKARGRLGETLAINDGYFESSLAHLKKVSGALKRDVEKKYGATGPE